MADAGLARSSSSSTASSSRPARRGRSSPCRAGTCTLPYRSVRYSTLPALNSLDRLARRRASRCRSSGSASGRADRGMRPSLPTWPMRSGRRDRDVEVHEPALDPGHEVLGADDVRAGLLGGAGRVALREDRRRARVLPVPFGSDTVPRSIWSALRGSTPSRNAASTVSSNFAGARRLHQVERLDRVVELVPVEPLARVRVLLAVLGHAALLFDAPSVVPRDPVARSSTGGSCGSIDQTTSRPIERAVPSTWAIAPSRSIALRSGIFCSAIARTWALVTLPAFSRGVSDEPFSIPAAWRSRNGVGGRLGDERERPVLVDRDVHRDDLTPLVLGRLRCTPCRSP